jgi:hypothetical protein
MKQQGKGKDRIKGAVAGKKKKLSKKVVGLEQSNSVSLKEWRRMERLGNTFGSAMVQPTF